MMLDPLVKIIEVPCDQEKAFTIFIDEMATWWPLGKFTTSAMSGAAAVSIKVESHKDGRIVEIGPDGSEHLWGSIKEYNPYDFLSMHFHIPTPNEKVEDRSLVEVRFTKLAEKLTKVELKQSNWEAFGKRAKMLLGGYGGGWDLIFLVAYKEACSKNK
jgi:uncharacterized protein YndB with AHSA1/START domain